jgi:FKBP-type peptidyl-prolyl cis-trans isomerase (trigger factor)
MTLQERAKLVQKLLDKNKLDRLLKLVESDTPTRLMARELRMTVTALYSFASRNGVSLKPTNQSPRTKLSPSARSLLKLRVAIARARLGLLT